jgi:hypothetical protein
MKHIFKILLFSSLILSLFSCRKELGKADWDMDISAPLIHSSLGINNLLADSLIHQEADSSLTLVYNNTLYSFSVDSLVDIPDTIKHVVYQIPITVPTAPGTQIINTTDNKILDLGGAAITKIIIRSGFINVDVKNTITQKIKCTYTIPCATNNGNILEITDMVPAATNAGPSVYSRSVDISGYTFDLTGTDGTSANILKSIIQAWTDPDGESVEITPSDYFDITTTFDDIIIEYARGYFGNQLFESGVETTNFDLFKKITDGSLLLENLHLVLNVTNGFGADASLLIHEIKSVNSHTGNTVALNSTIINSLINISRAEETFNPSSPVNPTLYSFNMDNTNFKQLIENLPDKIEYSLDVTTDPLGNVSSGNDFVYNGYGFDANLDLEIPLSVIATNLTLTDTIDFNLDQPSGYSVNNGILTLIADNGFPFNATSQIYLLDENNSITDSLMTLNNTITSAPLDAQDKVISPKETKIIVPVTGDRLDHLFTARKMILKIKFNTANQGHYIKIYSDYGIDLKLTGDFNMTVNEN